MYYNESEKRGCKISDIEDGMTFQNQNLQGKREGQNDRKELQYKEKKL